MSFPSWTHVSGHVHSLGECGGFVCCFFCPLFWHGCLSAQHKEKLPPAHDEALVILSLFFNHLIWSKLNCPFYLELLPRDNTHTHYTHTEPWDLQLNVDWHMPTHTHTSALMVWVVSVIDGSHQMMQLRGGRGGVICRCKRIGAHAGCGYIRHPVSWHGPCKKIVYRGPPLLWEPGAKGSGSLPYLRHGKFVKQSRHIAAVTMLLFVESLSLPPLYA